MNSGIMPPCHVAVQACRTPIRRAAATAPFDADLAGRKDRSVAVLQGIRIGGFPQEPVAGQPGAFKLFYLSARHA